MQIASLGSGSEGNAWVFKEEKSPSSGCLMVDNGFTVKEAVSRLERIGVAPDQISGLLVTHEHDDHMGGAFKFSRRFLTPVYLTHGSWRAALASKKARPDALETGLIRLIDSESLLEVGPFRVETFPVPHDAKEPVQLLVHWKNYTAGLLTDCGSSTPHLIRKLQRAQVLILESNHCPDMLAHSEYPPSLKKRVGGDYGHLSNQVACEILQAAAQGSLQYVVAAHLSRNTNCPELVRTLWAEVLAPKGIAFDIACQEHGLQWLDVPSKANSSVKKSALAV